MSWQARPATVWQETDELQSSMQVDIRGVAYSDDDESRGAVTITTIAPEGFFFTLSEGGGSATLLMTPDEARGIAAWLDEAATAADEVGLPLYY